MVKAQGQRAEKESRTWEDAEFERGFKGEVLRPVWCTSDVVVFALMTVSHFLSYKSGVAASSFLRAGGGKDVAVQFSLLYQNFSCSTGWSHSER